TMLARTLGPVPHLRGALKRLGLMAMHTALLSAAITLFTDVVYGTLAGHFWFLFLTLWLYVVAVCLAITGIAELAGPLASIVLIGLFIVFGNTSSGGAVPRPLLDGFFSALNPVLPQGAALSALRGVQYFGDHGIGTGLLCLTIWAAAALVIRYFRSKNDLFVLVRQPDLQLTPAPGQPLTTQNVTRALVELSLAQGTRLFDVTTVGRPEATELLRDQMETMLVRPLMDAF